jgi:hypothetical protein
MRFISPFAAYKIVAVHQKTEPLADGTSRIIGPGYTCHFRQADTTDWEREVAREKLHFRGTTKYTDGSPVDPITRVSTFDTDTVHATDCACPRGSTPVTASCRALKEKVEKSLLRNEDLGKQDGYILVEKPKLPAPWAAYDELAPHGQRKPAHVAAKNIETATATGVSLEHLVAYERQLARKGGEEIIAAYEAAMTQAEQSEPEPELIEA